MVRENLAKRREHFQQLVGVGIPAQVQCRVEPDLIPAGNVFKLHGRKLGVGNANDCAIGSTDARGTQTNVRYSADPVAELADISHEDGTIADYRDSAKQVFDGLL